MAEPFSISVPDAELAFLKERLATARYPDILENINPWEDGTDLEYFKEFVDYFHNSYDWRQWESKLNGMPQFRAAVRGIDVHFVHIRSESPDGAVPLLLLHGWPGSFFEFYKLVPILKEKGNFNFVIPSLPGYGFSSAAKHRGCGATAIAAIMDELMTGVLGYPKYLAQGGDWGSIVCRALALNHPRSCAAIHVNMCVAMPRMTNPWHLLQIANLMLFPWLPVFISKKEMQGVNDLRSFQKNETGYQKIQGTKPQTLAYALQDSPVGLAAWLLEKFKTWSDCGGHPEGAFTRDELITNICIYWFGGRIASSMRLYKETIRNRAELTALYGGYSRTPCAVAVFPKELYRVPRRWAAAAYNVQQWSEMPKGGHFAALEQPQLLAADVLRFCDLARRKGWL